MTEPAPTQLPIVGMTCAACVRRVESAIAAVPGVSSVVVNLATRSAHIAGAPSTPAVVAAVVAAGYEVPTIADATNSRAAALEAVERAETTGLDRDLRWALVLAIPVLVLGMSHGLLPMNDVFVIVQAALSAAVVLGPGRRFLRAAWHAIAARTADMNVLVALGVTAAWLASAGAIIATLVAGHPAHHAAVYFEAAAAIVLFVLVGKRLEARARRGLADAIRGLASRIPDQATRLEGEAEITTPVAALVPGDRVRLRPGAKIPADGVVLDGAGSVDEAMLTGESVPVDKHAPDAVHQGALVVDGSFVMEVRSVGRDTALGRMVDAVERAQGDKAPIARLADRVAAVFVPIVLGLAALTFIVHLLVGSTLGSAFEHLVAVLVIACPCALGLATPAAVAVATGRLAELGVVVRGGATLEALAGANRFLIDKTGTLTRGRAEVRTVAFLPDIDPTRALSLVAAAEAGSEHPIGRALVAYATEHEVMPRTASMFSATPGAGIRATVEGVVVDIGTVRHFTTLGFDLGAIQPFDSAATARGETAVLVALDGRPVGVLGVFDPPRAEAADIIGRLVASGIEVVLLTGDRRAVAEVVARSVGITQVDAEVTPDAKVAHVEAQRRRGGRVVMIGDGVNDAPALAAADVGIAVAHGADVTLGVADVVLMRDGLEPAWVALALARRTLHIIRQNLVWAFGYNVLAIPVAAGLFAGVGVTLSPALASLAMALSSVSVVLNALRLRRFSPGAATMTSPTPTQPVPMPVPVPVPELVLTVTGMTCGHCQKRVDQALRAVPGVTDVHVSLTDGQAKVTGSASADALTQAVVKAGYDATIA